MPHSAVSSPPVPRIARPIRVLIVDDDADNVMVLLELLRDEGHEAAGFESGQAALDSMDSVDPDVVVSDIVMRVPNGWDIAREVRNRKGPGRPLLIAISGKYTMATNRMFAQILGFDFFLPKPCDPQLLLALIETARR